MGEKYFWENEQAFDFVLKKEVLERYKHTCNKNSHDKIYFKVGEQWKHIWPVASQPVEREGVSLAWRPVLLSQPQVVIHGWSLSKVGWQQPWEDSALWPLGSGTVGWECSVVGVLVHVIKKRLFVSTTATGTYVTDARCWQAWPCSPISLDRVHSYFPDKKIEVL